MPEKKTDKIVVDGTTRREFDLPEDWTFEESLLVKSATRMLAGDCFLGMLAGDNVAVAAYYLIALRRAEPQMFEGALIQTVMKTPANHVSIVGAAEEPELPPAEAAAPAAVGAKRSRRKS
jgi:hypothetical protein